jgi:hypothetical protein
MRPRLSLVVRHGITATGQELPARQEATEHRDVDEVLLGIFVYLCSGMLRSGRILRRRALCGVLRRLVRLVGGGEGTARSLACRTIPDSRLNAIDSVDELDQEKSSFSCS